MAAVLEDVHLRGYCRRAKGRVEHQGIFHGHRLVVRAVDQERGRRIAIDLRLVRALRRSQSARNHAAGMGVISVASPSISTI